MASIFVNMEHGIEVAATDVLKFLTQSEALTTKMGPGVVAALGVLLGAAATSLSALSQAAAAPLDVQLDIQTVHDLQAVWPDVEAFAQSLGIKL